MVVVACYLCCALWLDLFVVDVVADCLMLLLFAAGPCRVLVVTMCCCVLCYCYAMLDVGCMLLFAVW